MNQPQKAMLLSQAMSASTVFLFTVTDADGCCIAANDLCATHFPGEELKGRMFSEFLHPEDVPVYYTTLVKTELCPQQAFSVYLRKKPLRTRKTDEWVCWELVALAHEGEGAIQIAHTGYPVSGQHFADNAGDDTSGYEISISKLKALVNHIPGAIYRCRGNEHLSLEFFSDEIEKLTGYPVEYFLRNRERGYLNLVYEEDEQPLRNTIQYALAKHEKFEVEYRIIHKDGTIRWMYESGQAVYDDEDKVDYIDGCIFDITRRRQTEAALARTKDEKKNTLQRQEELLERLTLATNSAEIGIFEIDLETNKVIWDDRMYAIYGHPPDTRQSIYKIFYNAVHPEDMKRMTEVIKELTTQKKEVNGAVYRIILPDGRVRYIDAHAILKKSGTGGIISLIGTNRDITEAVMVQEKIKMQNKVLREIAFIQSHEVRKPLANILGVIEILKLSGDIQELEIFEHLVESAHELDQQIRVIVNKTNSIDDEVFR